MRFVVHAVVFFLAELMGIEIASAIERMKQFGETVEQIDFAKNATREFVEKKKTRSDDVFV